MTNYCQFEIIGKNTIRCKICHFCDEDCNETDMSRIIRECPRKPTDKPPSILKRAVSYTLSTAKAVSTGNRICTQEEINARLAICHNCPRFLPDKIVDGIPSDTGICLDCGCCGSSKRSTWQNKLARKSERCPHNYW